DRVAVAEDFLDVVRPVEQIETLFDVQAWAKGLKESQRRLAVGRVIVPFACHVHVMCLYVEDELVLGPLLRKGFLVLDFGSVHFVAIAEDLVERHECRSKAAATTEEVAPAHTLSPGRALADRKNAILIFLLLRRLRRRNELLIGGYPRGNRQRGIETGIQITLTNPHGETPKTITKTRKRKARKKH